MIDRSHLHRLLVNLCLNARDAMDGPGTVSHFGAARCTVDGSAICASCHAEFSGEFLRIAVSDQGCGIPEAIRGPHFRALLHDQAKWARVQAWGSRWCTAWSISTEGHRAGPAACRRKAANW
jgi:nitrogen-specific signal transduction histidine kinase